ncbi:Ribulose bisphosphate carboxylase/oxygenase activase, chloroplastic [Glycine soja]|uniref:Ribulose bisphosphate carboxylase/oxygenase activase, chloroplastic n=1 Tax=Glycine soja TaxID=3848 RepID=A0A445JK42_GLYSO|nr:Ribulose bisphosphate carboxylase/oxygenase activase, chloroplastic [Glycine soja]
MSLHYNKTNGMQFMIADFFSSLRARVYDDEVRKWISVVGVDFIGKKLVNKMTSTNLLEYGNMLVQEQKNRNQDAPSFRVQFVN